MSGTYTATGVMPLLVGLTAVTFSCSGAKGVEASSNLIRHDMDSFGGASGELARKRE